MIARISWATAVDSSTGFSTSCRGTSSGIRSTLPAAAGFFGGSSACLSKKTQRRKLSSTEKTCQTHQDTHQCQWQETPCPTPQGPDPRRIISGRISHPITLLWGTRRQLGDVPKGTKNSFLRFIKPKSIESATKGRSTRHLNHNIKRSNKNIRSTDTLTERSASERIFSP